MVIENISDEFKHWLQEKFPGADAVYFFDLRGLYTLIGNNKTDIFKLPNKFIKELYGDLCCNIDKLTETYFEKYVPLFDELDNSQVYVDKEVLIFQDKHKFIEFYDSLNETYDKALISDNIETHINYMDSINIDTIDFGLLDITQEIYDNLNKFIPELKLYIEENKENISNEKLKHLYDVVEYSQDLIDYKQILHLHQINIL